MKEKEKIESKKTLCFETQCFNFLIKFYYRVYFLEGTDFIRLRLQ